MRWWTADWHLNHENIINHCPGRLVLGDTVEEMNEGLILRHNAVVSPGDDVMIIGDLAMGSIMNSLALLDRFNGNLFLVPGNHDRPWIGNKPAYRKKWEDIYESHGITLLPEQLTLTIGDGDDIVNVCHFPYTGESVEGRTDRYPEYRMFDDGTPLLHGHVHDAYLTNGNQYNVGVDAPGNDYFPIPDSTIVDWLNTLKD